MRHTFFSRPVFALLASATLLALGACVESPSTDQVTDPVVVEPQAEDPELLPEPEATPLAPSFQKVEGGVQISHLPGQTGFLPWQDTKGWSAQGLGLDGEGNPHPSSVTRVGGVLPPIELEQGTFYGGAAVDMSSGKPEWGDNTSLWYALTPPEGCQAAEIVEGTLFVGTAQEASLGKHFAENLYGTGVICSKG